MGSGLLGSQPDKLLLKLYYKASSILKAILKSQTFQLVTYNFLVAETGNIIVILTILR